MNGRQPGFMVEPVRKPECRPCSKKETNRRLKELIEKNGPRYPVTIRFVDPASLTGMVSFGKRKEDTNGGKVGDV